MGEVLCSGGSVREKGNKDYDSRKMIQIFFRVSLFAIVYFGRQHYTEAKKTQYIKKAKIVESNCSNCTNSGDWMVMIWCALSVSASKCKGYRNPAPDHETQNLIMRGESIWKKQWRMQNVLQNWKNEKTTGEVNKQRVFCFFDCNAGAYLYCGWIDFKYF